MKYSFTDKFLSTGTIFETRKNRFLIGYGERHWHEKECDSVFSPQWYFPDFFLTLQKPWFTHQYWEEVTKQELLDRLGTEEASQVATWKSFGEFYFETAFRTFISSSNLKKIVPYFFHLTDQPLSLKNRLLAALKKESKLSLYGFWDGQEGLLGATPETLFEFQADGSIQTEACAGTIVNEETPDATQVKKLEHEHFLVIQDISESLTPFGKVEIKGSKWHPFGALQHLITPINLIPNKPLAFQQVVEKLHPTAAIGAHPKDIGMKWLIDYDRTFSRHRFAAPAGCLFQGQAVCRVGIRNMQWDARQTRIGAGVGVIKSSVLEEEKIELQAKIAAIKVHFNL